MSYFTLLPIHISTRQLEEDKRKKAKQAPAVRPAHPPPMAARKVPADGIEAGQVEIVGPFTPPAQPSPSTSPEVKEPLAEKKDPYVPLMGHVIGPAVVVEQVGDRMEVEFSENSSEATSVESGIAPLETTATFMPESQELEDIPLPPPPPSKAQTKETVETPPRQRQQQQPVPQDEPAGNVEQVGEDDEGFQEDLAVSAIRYRPTGN